MSKNQQLNKKTTQQGQSLKQAPGRTVKNVLRGGVVSSDFFFRHKLKIFVALVLIVVYISTKYQCMTGMETIKNLENELEVVKTERIRERSRYMSRIRESAMASTADSIRPGLAVQQKPPYILHY